MSSISQNYTDTAHSPFPVLHWATLACQFLSKVSSCENWGKFNSHRWAYSRQLTVAKNRPIVKKNCCQTDTVHSEKNHDGQNLKTVFVKLKFPCIIIEIYLLVFFYFSKQDSYRMVVSALNF